MFFRVRLAVITPVLLSLERVAATNFKVVSLMVKVLALEGLVPGVVTLTLTLPGLAIKEAGTAALSWVEET